MARVKLFRPQPKRARTRAGQAVAATPRRSLLQAQARALEVTENWIASIAEPRFANAIREALALTDGDAWAAMQRHFLNPIDVTYYILQGEVPSTSIPLKVVGENRYNFLKLQSDDPKLEDYYPDQRILTLYRKIHRKVEAALLRLRRSRRKSVLLFPL